jgi:hypothetical protein
MVGDGHWMLAVVVTVLVLVLDQVLCGVSI